MALDRQQILEKYNRGVQSGAANYRTGVQGSGQQWQERASSDQAENAWRAGVERAAQARRRQNAVRNVGAQRWEQAAMETGASNYAASAAKATERYSAQVDNVIAAGQAAQQAARQISGETIQQRIQRAGAAAIAIHRHWARQRGENPEV